MNHSSDTGPISGAARRTIERVTGVDLSAWKGPEVTADRDDYKLTWYPPDDGPVDQPGYDDAVLTVYKTGDWDLYALDGRAFSGRMMCFHDRRWIRKLIRGGAIPGLAVSSWMYFKRLSGT